MKQIIIIGARGFGRESYHLFSSNKAYSVEYQVKGFLDDKSDALDATPGYPAILGPVETYEIQEDDVFFCALGDPVQRKKYVEIILEKGGKFISCISDSAYIASTAQIGEGVFIGPHTIISADVKLGDYTIVHSFCNFGHDTSFGKYCEVEAYVAMGGYSSMEDMCTVHPHATVLPRIRIRKGGSVGAGSVVIKNVKEGTTVFGVPAKVMEF